MRLNQLAPPKSKVPLSAKFPPHVVYLIVGGIGALLLCFITPPFEVPDEAQHFFRSFQLSELEYRGSVQGSAPGTVLPSSLPQLVEHFLGTRLSHTATRPLRPHPLSDTWSQFDKQLLPARREFVEFGTITYSPISYAPQAVAIAIMRIIVASPLADLYAARLANAISSVALLTWALRFMPLGREAAFVVALLPMWQFMVGSASPDAMILSSALVIIVLGLRCYQCAKWSAREVVLALIAGTMLCATKPVYLPLLLIGLPAAVPSPRDPPNVRRNKALLVLFHAIVIVLVLGITFAWVRFNSAVLASLGPGPMTGSSAARQVSFIMSNPIEFVRILGRTIEEYSGDYIRQGIGVLGWLNVPLPTWLYLLGLGAFFVAVLFSARSQILLRRLALAWVVILIASCASLIEIALYLAWTPVGAPVIEGVQGRYFLPMLPLAGAAMSSFIISVRKGTCTEPAYAVVIVAVVLITAGTIWTVVADYRLF